MNSKAPISSSECARLINDISSYTFEKKRDHVASAVDCYMKQFGTTKEETYKELLLRMEETWKYMNQEMIRSTEVSMQIFNRIINMTRILYDYYEAHEDGYTMNKFLKPKVVQVLVDPVPI